MNSKKYYVPRRASCAPLFSPEDADLAKLKWRTNRKGYPCRKFYDAATLGSEGKWFCAHHVVIERILGRPRKPGEITDHANHDKMDARRENLRVTDLVGSAQNRKFSQWRGTTWHKQAGKWQALVTYRGKAFHLGLFEQREQAANAAAEKRKQLNFLEATP